MRIKTLVSTLLILALIMVPMLTMAEPALDLQIPLAEVPMETGSFTLRLSDLMFSIPSDGATLTQDLTGLGLQLGGVLDTSDATNPMGLLSLMVLAVDDPAVSAMLGYDKDGVYALLNGLSSVITISMEDLQALAEQSVEASGVTDIASAYQMEALEFTEGPVEQVQFYSTSGEYPRYSLSLSPDQLKRILQEFGDVELPQDMSSYEISYFTDGEANLLVESTMYYAADTENLQEKDLIFTLMAEIQEDGTLNIGGNIDNLKNQIALNVNGHYDQALPDSYTFNGMINAKSKTDDSTNFELQFSLTPTEEQGGVISNLFSMMLLDGGAPLGSLQATSRVTESDERYSLYLTTEGDIGALTADYTGTITKSDADTVHAGQFSFEMVENTEPVVSAQFNLSLNLSADVTGKFPDISDMTKIDYSELEGAEAEQLRRELEGVGLSALGKLMTIPSLAQLISSMMIS